MYRGQLVRERFAVVSRPNDEDIAPLKQRVNHSALARAECPVAELRVQCRLEGALCRWAEGRRTRRRQRWRQQRGGTATCPRRSSSLLSHRRRRHRLGWRPAAVEAQARLGGTRLIVIDNLSVAIRVDKQEEELVLIVAASNAVAVCFRRTPCGDESQDVAIVVPTQGRSANGGMASRCQGAIWLLRASQQQPTRSQPAEVDAAVLGDGGLHAAQRHHISRHRTDLAVVSRLRRRRIRSDSSFAADPLTRAA